MRQILKFYAESIIINVTLYGISGNNTHKARYDTLAR